VRHFSQDLWTSKKIGKWCWRHKPVLDDESNCYGLVEDDGAGSGVDASDLRKKGIVMRVVEICGLVVIRYL
jgi:hypothetical protein